MLSNGNGERNTAFYNTHLENKAFLLLYILHGVFHVLIVKLILAGV